MRTTLKNVVTTALRDQQVTRAEADAIRTKVLANKKVSKAEAAEVRRALKATRFETGAREVLVSLLPSEPTRPPQLTVEQAKKAATALGGHLDQVRKDILALDVNMDDRATFETVIAQKFGPGQTREPLLGGEEKGMLTLTPIWPGVAPYPRIKIDPASGQLYFHDAARSPKWFGPTTPPGAAKIVGTFTNENDRFEILSAYVRGEHATR